MLSRTADLYGAGERHEYITETSLRLNMAQLKIRNLLDITSRAELRQWLVNNHSVEPECGVVVKRGRPVDDNTFWYVDAVEEALCFGWIDSTTKKISDGVTA